jgi:hypothetical protein
MIVQRRLRDEFEWFTTSSSLLVSFPWLRFLFVDVWWMEIVSLSTALQRESGLPSLWQSQRKGACVALLALSEVWCATFLGCGIG